MKILKNHHNLTVQTETYQFYVNLHQPLWASLVFNNFASLRLFLLPQINVSDKKDNVGEIVSVSLEREQESVALHLVSRSECWDSKDVFWKFSEHNIDHYCIIKGSKEFQIDDLSFLGDCAGERQLSFGNFDKVFCPSPNADGVNEFKPSEVALNSISARVWRGGIGFFTPAPFFVAFQWNNQISIGLGIFCKPGENNFSNFAYIGSVDGFALRLDYDSATKAKSPWIMPTLRLYFGNDRFDLLEQYCRDLYINGFAQKNNRQKKSWWFGPIFCGWGEQCSQAMRLSLNKRDHKRNLELARSACTQKNYQHWLCNLRKHGLKPQILIIDDGWAESAGSVLPNPERWSDLRGFIENCHQQGIKVLLWWNCWESDVIPYEETIRSIEGTSAIGVYGSRCADPTNPAFIQRFKKIIFKLLGRDKGCLNADGLKVDILGSLPSGKGYIVYDNLWGVELLKAMLSLIYEAAKEVKDEALIESHSANSYFNDTLDMLRLNDIICPEGKELDVMKFRYEVARRASPDWLIDTDGWPIRNLEHLHKYVRLQPELGVPALYYAKSLGETPVSFTDEEYSLIRSVWSKYLSSIKKRIGHPD